MILLAAGLTGFAVLTLEVLGVHLLAPWFGTSALIWANQIGVVLLALAIGAWLGGWRARTTARPLSLAGALMIGAGALVGLALVLLPLLADWLVPERMRLDEAAGVALGGSLAATLILIAPPVLVLGMVAPLLIQVRAEARGAGRAAGELSAVGTIGSLLGVFGTSLVAIPQLGTRTTLVVTAAILVLVGALLFRGRWQVAAAGALVLLPLPFGDASREANMPEGAQLVEAVDTPYQRLRVIEFRDESAPPGSQAKVERWLQMNEGLDSFQSRAFNDEVWPGGYYDLFVLAPVYALHGHPDPSEVRFWSLGHAGGSAMGPVAAALHGTDWRGVGVELDPEVVRLTERRMAPLPEVRQRVEVLAGADARAMLKSASNDLDFILLDAYTHQFEIPLHLATEEFFAEVYGHLREGGVLAINVGTHESSDDSLGFIDALRSAVATSFGPHLRVQRVAYSRNMLLFARKQQALPALSEIGSALPENVPIEVAAACLPSSVEEGAPKGEPSMRLRDDRNPLSLAQARSWWKGLGDD